MDPVAKGQPGKDDDSCHAPDESFYFHMLGVLRFLATLQILVPKFCFVH